MSSRVAVIMVDTNEGRWFERNLQCLREQTRPPDRIIVADNGSTDGSPEMIAERFPEVEVLPLGRNAGFTGANNAAVREARDCDWVALLNPDAFADPGWLEGLLEAAEREPAFSFFSSRMMRETKPDELDGTGDVYHVSGLAWRRDHGRLATDSPHTHREQEVFAACAGAAMYRRDAWDEVGGFDDSYFVYMEDLDLSFRLRLAGHRCLYVPTSVVHHVGSGTTGYESEFTVYLSHRNLVWTWVKDMPLPLALLYLPQHLLVNLLTVIWFSTRGRGKAILRAKRDAVRGLPRVLGERRRVQAGRKISARELRPLLATGAGAYTTAFSRARDTLLRRR